VPARESYGEWSPEVVTELCWPRHGTEANPIGVQPVRVVSTCGRRPRRAHRSPARGFEL